MIKKLEKYGYPIVIACIFLLGFLLRLKGMIVNPSFWHDECALGWNVIHKDYSGFFSVLRFLQVAPPFFMVLSKICTQIFGVSDLTLRLVPFFFGVSSIGLFFVLVSKIFKNRASVVASLFLFSINQNLVNYSSEFKHYSCDVFFTMLCIYLFLNLLLDKISLKKTIVYSLVLAVSMWFSFVSLFAIAAGFVVLAIKRIIEKDFEIKEILILTVPLLISGLLYLKFYLINTYIGNQTGMTTYWASGFIAKDFSNFLHLIAFNINYLFFPITLILFVFIILLVGVYITFRENFYVGLLLFLTFVMECIVSWLGIYPFEKRAILFLLPVFLIFVCTPFEWLDIKKKIKSVIILLLYVLIFTPAILNSYYVAKIEHPSRGYYPKEMMEEMLKRIRPGDIILINQNSNTEFAYYASFHDIKNEIYQEPQKGDPGVLLRSLKVGRYYWFYEPHRPSIAVEDWLSKNKNIILYEWGYPRQLERLRYIYIKNKPEI